MTKQNFYENQIFEQEYPPEAANFCNNSQETENKFYIEEIEPTKDGVRRFQIRRNPEPTAAETSERRIQVLKAYLSETDWYCARYVDSGVPIPEEVQSKRQEAREEISALRGELDGSQ